METENKETMSPDTAQSKPRKKRRYTALIVVLIYTVICVVFGLFLSKGLDWLEGWLTDYEAAQPKVKSQQIFEELFAQPDWAALYTMAGGEDTIYESAEHYADYMQDKVGDRALSYSETSAGLSGDHKYIVKLGEEKVAEFTLTAQEHTVTDIPDWTLGQVRIFFSRERSVRICCSPEYRVFVNGVELTEAHIVKTMHTDVDAYLPENVHGLRRCWMYEEGFLVAPQVRVVNEAGEEVALVYDEASATYTEPLPADTMTPEQETTVLEATKAYCRYMANALGAYGLSKYFDAQSDIYAIVTDADIWMLYYREYHFGEPTFSEYYRYSDTLYSVKIKMSFFGTGRKGVEIEFPVDATFFLEQKEDGNWLVVNMLNTDVQKQNISVRIRYMQDGQVLADQMVDSAATVLTPPQVAVPEGMVFAGWYTQQTDENGNITYNLAFSPDEEGHVHLSQGIGQEEMTLYALFERAG